MARKHKHEDHINHEAWAIPYGDLVTLLLAFFVVMYSMSSVNEGKYRVLSDSLVAAFRGAPRTTQPIQIGDKTAKTMQSNNSAVVAPGQLFQLPGRPGEHEAGGPSQGVDSPGAEGNDEGGVPHSLRQISDEIEAAMKSLIDDELVHVTRRTMWVEIEINTDILFPSGRAGVVDDARPVLNQIARILGRFENPIRVEGHTDNKPISTRQFPSNWELSAARAAGVVHLFSERGVQPERLVVAGMGEYQPVADNTTAPGRNRNRRVVLIVLDGIERSNIDDAGMLGQSTEGAPVRDDDAGPVDAVEVAG